jgi:hypothetical protein
MLDLRKLSSIRGGTSPMTRDDGSSEYLEADAKAPSFQTPPIRRSQSALTLSSVAMLPPVARTPSTLQQFLGNRYGPEGSVEEGDEGFDSQDEDEGIFF